MRLDKYLKVSRIIKRRTVAKEVADKGRIKVNGILAKSSTDLKTDDIVEIRFGNKLLTVKVLEMKDRFLYKYFINEFSKLKIVSKMTKEELEEYQKKIMINI